jgi:hypothetical protein
MHPAHNELKKLFEGQKIKIVRTALGALELTLSSTVPAVTVVIEGTDFQVKAFGDKGSVKPTAEHWFSHFRDYGPPQTPGPREGDQ